MPAKILIIEDDRDILDMMQYIIEDEGYEVVALNEPEPIDEIMQHQPDLILLDERLPEISGHELCARIKADPATQNIPVILISAVPHIVEIAQDCQADAYIAKPFDLDELTAAVNRFS
jgi:DNA-binding response OmpR family regulator